MGWILSLHLKRGRQQGRRHEQRARYRPTSVHLREDVLHDVAMYVG
jgi:hypothetical protein